MLQMNFFFPKPGVCKQIQNMLLFSLGTNNNFYILELLWKKKEAFVTEIVRDLQSLKYLLCDPLQKNLPMPGPGVPLIISDGT